MNIGVQFFCVSTAICGKNIFEKLRIVNFGKSGSWGSLNSGRSLESGCYEQALLQSSILHCLLLS
jgi:positive regulator of sigma E activity